MFGCTVKDIAPLPVPEAVLTVIQGTFEVAVQGQPESVIILKLPFPPPAVILALVGESEYVQLAA